MTRLGMDVENVESLSNHLKSAADQLDQLIAQIDGLISQATTPGVWDGNDAITFHGWWTSQHKPALKSAEDAIRGLGQSAWNNAQEQRNTSGH